MKKIVALLAAALAFSCVPAAAQTDAATAESSVAAKQLMDAINARGLMQASMQKLFNDSAMLDELERETTAIYARNYSVDEMRQLLAFYRSPIGAKMLSTMPKVMQESMVASQKIIMPRIGKMVEEMTANIVKK